MKKSVYIGIDLHGNNLMMASVDAEGARLGHDRLPCDLGQVLARLGKFKGKTLHLAVESTYNWYWLVDGLQDAGYEVVLANPAGMEQYNGLKHADDKTDAYFIAELLRLGILQTGHIYERKRRGARDLLRRRQLLVSKRTALILSLKNQHARRLGCDLELGKIKSLESSEVARLFEDRHEQLAARVSHELIGHLNDSLAEVEKACWQAAAKMKNYQALRSLPGIGPVLAGVIRLETGPVERFASPECFASYSRTVGSRRESNGKKKGENNRKCGNRYLGWAFIEAANLARRYDEHARRWFDRKASKTNKVVATKALACKFSKAAWHLMKAGGTYDPARLFGTAA